MRSANADALRLRARMAAADALRDPAPAARATGAQQAACSAFEQSWAAARASVEAEGAIACAPGCAACCHQHVAVLPIEAVAIAQALAADPDPARRHRLEASGARIGTMDAMTRRRARIPCAFLAADGTCGIYAYRPIRCRGVHARDAALCLGQTEDPDAAAAERAQRVGDHPAFPRLPVTLADAALAGLAAACAARGIAHDSLEMTSALLLLLTAPERAAAVMAGIDDLAEARLDTAARPVAGG
jgi:Fe-S-cluster containining protein